MLVHRQLHMSQQRLHLPITDIEVALAGNAVIQAVMTVHLEGSKLVEVGCKEGGAANGLHEVLRDGPGQPKAIVGGCAPPQLINDHQ